MKKRKHERARLELSRQTIRALSPRRLGEVVGGTTTVLCTHDCGTDTAGCGGPTVRTCVSDCC